MTFKLRNYEGIQKLILFLVPFFLLIDNALAIEQYTAHGGPVKGLAVSDNNKYLASASFDYSVVIWNLNPIRENSTLIGHDASVNTVKFSPSNNLLASGGDDYKVILWKISEPLVKNDEIIPNILG
ncbi:MAG: hypothetical protein P8N41_09820, partial [Alphaproteobacteria bacterium]|nr:hypothetical protein [Alphaproteobacteria bacterium]